jgi:hypothetical protein
MGPQTSGKKRRGRMDSVHGLEQVAQAVNWSQVTVLVVVLLAIGIVIAQTLKDIYATIRRIEAAVDKWQATQNKS